MGFNMEQLQRTTGINPIPLWIKAGNFSHRHPRETPDPEQTLIRQLYLNKVPNDEWLLVLDSDEIILGGLEMIAPVLEMANNDIAHDYKMDPLAEQFKDLHHICIPSCVRNRVDVICISEILPDMTIINRPRFIKKREGLKYGGPDNKHDYIEYINHDHILDAYGLDNMKTHLCLETCITTNYINPKVDNPYMWTMEGVFFWHNKNGALKIYRDDDSGEDMKAFNLISVKNKELKEVTTMDTIFGTVDLKSEKVEEQEKEFKGNHPQKGCSQYDYGGWTHDVKCELETMVLINETEEQMIDRYNSYKEIVRD